MNGKIEIKFICYTACSDNGNWTRFSFYPSGEWDEEKYTIDEALKAYPTSEYEWIHTDNLSEVFLFTEHRKKIAEQKERETQYETSEYWSGRIDEIELIQEAILERL